MKTTFQILNITIQRKLGQSWPVVIEYTRPDTPLPIRHEGILHLQPSELVWEDLDPQSYGTKLGQALFVDDIRDAFIASSRGSKDHVHVTLSIEARELKEIHWERLCAPTEIGWDFIAVDQRLPFSHHIPSHSSRYFPPIGRADLRALILAASPKGIEEYRLEPFDVDTSISAVTSALGDIETDVLADTDRALGPPTLDTLVSQISGERYTLLHIFCHGYFQASEEETILYLARGDGSVDPVTATRFIQRLNRTQGAFGLPHLIFLASCETALPRAELGLGGLGQRLVRDLGIPAVVAMANPITYETARTLSKHFYGQLMRHGMVDLALAEGATALTESYDVTVPALFSRLQGRPLFSDLVERPLTRDDIEAAIERIRPLLNQRAPILSTNFDTDIAPLQDLLQDGAWMPDHPNHEVFQSSLNDFAKIYEDVLDTNFRDIASGKPILDYKPICPFMGLFPFRSKNQDYFFGRDELVKQLQQRLDRNSFLAVLGPSGSGKSSLVLAGLLPKLSEQIQALQIVYLTPGENPNQRLDAGLNQKEVSNLIVVVDQFEELFTLTQDSDEREKFMNRLLAITENAPVIITMRADFWGDCAPYTIFKEAMQAHQELIAPMTPFEMRKAMSAQAHAAGLRFESGLEDFILEDVIGEPGAMPLLQHALQELWSRRHGRWLRTSEYKDIGGIGQAIAHTADLLYQKLSSEDQGLVQDIFLRLTRLDEDAGLGGERRDTRRRVAFTELISDKNDLASIRIMVNRLADARLVVTSVDSITSKEEVEVAHEALIRAWPRLQHWLDTNRDMLNTRERIRNEAQEWEANRRDQSFLLHRGKRLAAALKLLADSRLTINKIERDYILACQNEERGQNIWQVDADLVVHTDLEDTYVDIFLRPTGTPKGEQETGTGVWDVRLDAVQLAVDGMGLRELSHDPQAYGRALGQGLFSDPKVRQLLDQAVSAVKSQDKQLKVNLWLDPGAAFLHGLAWETLLAPDEREWPFPFADITFVRFFQTDKARLRSRRDLNTLIVSSGVRKDTRKPIGDSRQLLLQMVINGAPVQWLEYTGEMALESIFTHLEEERTEIVYLACPVDLYNEAIWLFKGIAGESDVGIQAEDLTLRLQGLTNLPRIVIIEATLAEEEGIESLGDDQEATARLAHYFLRSGIPAVLILPTEMAEKALDSFLASFLTSLNQHGEIDRAVASARAEVGDPNSRFLPILYTTMLDGRIWYMPGFAGAGGKHEKWPAILRAIKTSRFTPILGPKIVEPLFGSQQSIARQWADKYGYVSSPGEKMELAKVAQFLSIDQDHRFPIYELEEFYKKKLEAYLANRDLEEEVGSQNDFEGLLQKVGSFWRQNDPNQPHRLLAQLPLPIYITTNYDNFMAAALLEAGKDPYVIFHRWNEYTEVLDNIYAREPEYRPSVERPLIYNLFGLFSEPDSIVITENDSYEFLTSTVSFKEAIPRDVRRALADSTTLYLGFDFNDVYFKTVWTSTRLLQGRGARRVRHSHLVQLEPEVTMRGDRLRKYMDKYFDVEQFSIYWGGVEDIAQTLKEQLGEYK